MNTLATDPRFRTDRHLLRSAAACLSFLLLSSCAHQIPPSGGPADESGPRVVWSDPAPYSINVTTDRIQIEFDEYVETRSAEESIFISPPIDDVEYDWSGMTVTLSFPGPLRDSTTYVISVGTDVADLEPTRHNRMAQAFMLAFSTGPGMDRGVLSGRVLPRKTGDELSGVMVLAYNVPNARADGFNPTSNTATYLTQAGADGSFSLPHLRLGFYIVLALRDEARNLVYDIEEDEFAVGQEVFSLTPLDTARTQIVLRLAVQDTTGPFLAKVEPVDRNRVRLEFSEPVLPSQTEGPTAFVVDSTENRTTAAYGFTLEYPERKKAYITTDILVPERDYIVRLDRVMDDAGNQGMEHGLAMRFTGPEKVDSLPPSVVSLSVRDSAVGRSLTEEVLVMFSQDMTRTAWTADRVGLRQTRTDRDVPLVSDWRTNALLSVRSAEPLASDEGYTMSFRFYGMTDWRLRPIRDSVRVVHFRTVDVESLGSIDGQVIDVAFRDTTGPLTVTGMLVGGIETASVNVQTKQDGSFTLRQLKPGKYIVSAFRDRNNNGVHDAGRPYPVAFGERHSDFSDTLRVRPRWPLEGVVIRMQ